MQINMIFDHVKFLQVKDKKNMIIKMYILVFVIRSYYAGAYIAGRIFKLLNRSSNRLRMSEPNLIVQGVNDRLIV